MLAIRINNDINFRWDITVDDAPADLEAASAVVVLHDPNGMRCKLEYSYEGSTVIGAFRAKNQRRLGDYTLELILNKGKEGMATLDHVACWTLVPHTFMEGGDPCPHLALQRAHLAGNLTLDL